MSRVSLMSVVVGVLSVLIPSVAQAQIYVIPSCTDAAVVSRSSYDRPVPCVRPVPVPPTEMPAWLRPTPPVAPPAPVRPAVPAYPAPAPAARGLDPWIPLAVAPAPAQRPLDLMTQWLLLEQLAAARPRRQAAPAPVARTPAPPTASGDGWMSGFIKGVKK